jgi:hypothetical protein
MYSTVLRVGFSGCTVLSLLYNIIFTTVATASISKSTILESLLTYNTGVQYSTSSIFYIIINTLNTLIELFLNLYFKIFTTQHTGT